jgi:hypothetical protein
VTEGIWREEINFQKRELREAILRERDGDLKRLSV